jgi:hypothetical protein
MDRRVRLVHGGLHVRHNAQLLKKLLCSDICGGLRLVHGGLHVRHNAQLLKKLLCSNICGGFVEKMRGGEALCLPGGLLKTLR